MQNYSDLLLLLGVAPTGSGRTLTRHIVVPAVLTVTLLVQIVHFWVFSMLLLLEVKFGCQQTFLSHVPESPGRE